MTPTGTSADHVVGIGNVVAGDAPEEVKNKL